VIEAVVLWNEPNNLSHWDRSLDPDWALFAEMIRQAGERLGHLAPGLPRVLGGVSPMDPSFIRNLFGRGLEETIDVVAVHGFPLDWNRWHLSEWSKRIDAVRQVSSRKPVWVTEVGASTLVSPSLQAWATDTILEQLAPVAERVYWYSLMDLPECWEAMTRHRGSEGSAYYRHFRMGVCGASGRQKPAAARLLSWATQGVGVCEWVYWYELARLERMVQLLNDLGIRRVRTGIGWADWDRPGAIEWFDKVMECLAPFDVTVTLCFTPARAGRVPHHTSPPVRLSDFADFCEAVVRRYGTVRAGD
jgi:beta-xylosidase